MKTTRFLSVTLCLVLLCALALPAAAAEVSGSLSASSVLPSETLTMTVSMGQETVSSLGVTVRCDDGLSVSAGQWLQNGLMASFDLAKNKGVFSPGGATAMSGKIFRVTLDAVSPGSHNVSITLIGKNGSETVFEKTVTKTVQVTCTGHSYGDWEKDASAHWKTCSACGHKSQQNHSFGTAKITQSPTCKAEGISAQTCTTCGYTRTQAVPSTDHTSSGWIVDQPAAPGIGGSKYKKCTACGEELARESIPALPVAPAEPVEPAPTEPSSKPTEPAPTEPASKPSEPVVQPTEPAVTPTEPKVEEPTVPEQSPTEPAVPEETVPEETPTEPEATLPPVEEAEPAEQTDALWPVLCVPAVVIVLVLFLLLRKR